MVDAAGGVRIQPSEGAAALTLEGDVSAIVQVGLGMHTLHEMVDRGRLRVIGDDSALERFSTLFGLDRRVEQPA